MYSPQLLARYYIHQAEIQDNVDVFRTSQVSLFHSCWPITVWNGGWQTQAINLMAPIVLLQWLMPVLWLFQRWAVQTFHRQSMDGSNVRRRGQWWDATTLMNAGTSLVLAPLGLAMLATAQHVSMFLARLQTLDNCFPLALCSRKKRIIDKIQ